MRKLYDKILKKIYYYSQEKYAFIPTHWMSLFSCCYIVRKNLYNQIKEKAYLFSGKVLDIGCGQKPYESLFENCEEYIGLDYDTPEISYSKNVDYTYDGNTFPFENDSFDNIVSFQALEHIPNTERILSETSRVLKNNGYFLLTFAFAYAEHFKPYDYYRFTRYKIKELLENTGFEIVEIKGSTTTFENICLQINEFQFNHIKKHFLRLLNAFLINIITTKLLKKFPKDDDFAEGWTILARKKENEII